MDPRVKELFEKLDLGVQRFEREPEEVVRLCVDKLGYQEGDARDWLKTVKFSPKTEGVDEELVSKCLDILKTAGVKWTNEKFGPKQMIAP